MVRSSQLSLIGTTSINTLIKEESLMAIAFRDFSLKFAFVIKSLTSFLFII